MCWFLCHSFVYAQTHNTNNLDLVDLNLLQPTQANVKEKKEATFSCPPETFDMVAGVKLHEWSESKSFYFFQSDMPLKKELIDSEKMPYFTLHTEAMQSTNTKKGDIAYVYNRKTKKGCYAILGSVSPKNVLMEGSNYLIKQLGINENPANDKPADSVVCIVFPFSGTGAIDSPQKINAIGEKLMKKADAFLFISQCLH